MAGVNGNGKGFVADINVTPFVDVMLVLLIIFMVTAPMMTEGMEVDLPETQVVENLVTDTSHVVLTVRKDGAIFVDETQTGLETLGTVLNTHVTAQNKQLFLRADKDVPYGLVVNIMGRIKAAGIDHMGIVAERVEDAVVPAPQQTPVSGSDQTGTRARGR